MKIAYRARQRLGSSKLTQPDAEPIEARAHHLLCAICVRGGCENPPAGKLKIGHLLNAIWQYPYASLKITADLDVNRAHYLDVYVNRGRKALPKNFKKRQADYVNRRKDLEVLRLLGIAPNTALPAYLAYEILFRRARSLDNICRSTLGSDKWPECPHARKGYYEKITSEKTYSPKELIELGDVLDGKGIWAIIRPRTYGDMSTTKATSVKAIQKTDHLFIRPQHLLCILCSADVHEPLIQNNLVEVRKRMEDNPDIPVTLTEGCCMMCGPCHEYHGGENICIRTHIKNQLRDLNILEKLGMRPGDTLSAKELYGKIYARIGSLRDVCAWGDELDTAPFWSPCDVWKSDEYERARKDNIIAKGRSSLNTS